ncbi:hypothetical protein [Tatumella sp. OPLPL6]|uniref:hypothetical protein n=1 Tax=Tatumella sp. OPLPL6 TaxID=1928657 RepID=UPI000C17CBE9|nr:hypothetical protein [Tatumella sp. OPLPL6]PIJ43275.1 hypothetical protein BOM24_08880 [Tatumella sp. OPLPL6]
MSNMGLARPCANCPFLDSEKSIRHTLHPDRVESIKQGLLEDDFSGFLCHKTLDGAECDVGEYEETGNEHQCMGAMAWLHKQGRPSINMRLSYRDKEWRANLEASVEKVID